MTKMLHALSLDIEDFSSGLLLLACDRIMPPSSDVMRLTQRMLAMFKEHNVRATCFVLGEVAEAFPGLIRDVAAAGHELGVHGWHHHRVFQLQPETYRQSLIRAKALLEDISGRPVIGYRAVAMSITRATWWAYEILAELGFVYSSSVYPFKGRRYGMNDVSVGPHLIEVPGSRRILEIPLSVIQFGSLRVPVLGGGYLRHLPILFSRFALSRLDRVGQRAVVYLHPYELDTKARLGSFPVPVSDGEMIALRRWARGQFRNRGHTEKKVRALLSHARFAPLAESFEAEIVAMRQAP